MKKFIHGILIAFSRRKLATEYFDCSKEQMFRNNFVELNSNTLLFPNPAGVGDKIVIGKIGEVESVQIYDLTGRAFDVKHYIANNKFIVNNALPKGGIFSTYLPKK